MLAALVLTVPFLSGCNDGGPSSKMFVKNGKTDRMRVAVLPFDNVSKDQDAGRVLTNTVITYLLSTGSFDVVEPGMVYAAMGAENIRLTDGITAEMCQKLQPRLNADAYIMGMVEEYGEVRIGPDTYPSVSFSARLVNGRTADILWAATISKTGADNVKVFDIGRVSSLGKLSKSAVASLAVSLNKSRKDLTGDIATVLNEEAAKSGTAVAQETHGETLVRPVTTPPTTNTTTPPTPPTTTTTDTAPAGARSSDESAAYGEKELTALLKNFGSTTVSDVRYKKHYHDTLEAQYRLGDSGKTVDAKLVDYRNAATSLKFLQGYNPDATQTEFEALPAFTGVSEFGYYHLDVSVGRFGIFLRGPKDNQDEIDALGKSLVASLK